jgi:hypothetical protein
MGYAQFLSVITAVSRPELLPLIALSVPAEAEWILVTDGPREIPADLRSHVLVEGPATRQWGDVQRRIGLQTATRPFVYFLDDDNLMLPTLAELVIPFLEIEKHAGVLFGIVVNLQDQTHLWPAPLKVMRGRVDTAMFFGRREAVMKLRFPDPGYGEAWPDLRGERYGDFIFLEAFDNQFGLSRLPAIYGFHNGIDFLRNTEPECYRELEARELTPRALAAILSKQLIRADVPQWWTRETATRSSP